MSKMHQECVSIQSSGYRLEIRFYLVLPQLDIGAYAICDSNEVLLLLILKASGFSTTHDQHA